MFAPTSTKLSSKSREVLDRTIVSIDDLVVEVRSKINQVDAPKAQALLETTAEVLLGLRKAYLDYEDGNEEAWQ